MQLRLGHSMTTLEMRKKTNLERYGVEYPMQSKEILAKRKKTYLERYGVEHPLQSKEIFAKVEKTKLEKYGGQQLAIARRSRKEKLLKRNGVTKSIEEVYALTSFLASEVPLAQRVWLVVNNLHAIPKCKVCGKATTYNYRKHRYRFYCSNACANKEVGITSKKAVQEKYGVDNFGLIPGAKEKILSTRFRKTYAQFINSDRFKALVKPLFTVDEYKGAQGKYKFQCMKCGAVFEDVLEIGKMLRIPRCWSCFPRKASFQSNYEYEIISWLRSLGIAHIIQSNRVVIKPLELDIYLPDYALAIEFDGLYWHSELNGMGSNYHLNKTKLCNEKGVKLLHVFQDEWVQKQDIVKSIIRAELGKIEHKIYARDCVAKTIKNSEIVKSFYFENHIQGAVVGSYNCGLYMGDELVYCISVGKARYSAKVSYELYRSCSKVGTVVIGGFSKLVAFVTKQMQIESLISYVDRRYFDGKAYGSWKFTGEVGPSYFYMKSYTDRENRVNYQKYRLKELFPDVYDPVLTEWQIMQLAGYDRIWDCGNLSFVKEHGSPILEVNG